MEFVPPSRVFKIQPVDNPEDRHIESGYQIPDFLYPTRTQTGGMASVFKGHPFPRKGFIYNEAVIAIAKLKRIILMLIMPLTRITSPKRFFISLLENVIRLADNVFMDCRRIPYYHYAYYSEFGKATWDFVYMFVRHMGVPFGIAYRFGLLAAVVVEHDDAYKVPLIDLFSETTKEQLIENPRQEILRLSGIFKERSINFQPDGNGAGNRMELVALMLSYLLWLPPVKRAFRFAVQNVNFEWFQYDEWEEYWALSRLDYKVQGQEFEDRRNRQIGMMVEYAKKMNPGKLITIIPTPNGADIHVSDDETRDNHSMAEDNLVPAGSTVPSPAN